MTDTTSHHILPPQGYANPSTAAAYQNGPGMSMPGQQQVAPVDPRQGQQQQHHLYQTQAPQAQQPQQPGYPMVRV
jgi:hypothetical protein